MKKVLRISTLLFVILLCMSFSDLAAQQYEYRCPVAGSHPQILIDGVVFPTLWESVSSNNTTLFSLSQATGYSVAELRKMNCLSGVVPRNIMIWYPSAREQSTRQITSYPAHQYDAADLSQGAISPYHLESAMYPVEYRQGGWYFIGERAADSLWVTYTLRERDTMTVYDLAEMFRIPPKVLMQINGISEQSATRMLPGTPVSIPAAVPIDGEFVQVPIALPKGWYPGFIERMFSMSKAQQLLEFYQPGNMTAYSNLPTGRGYVLWLPYMSEWEVELFLTWYNRQVAEMSPHQALQFCSSLDNRATIDKIHSNIRSYAGSMRHFVQPDQLMNIDLLR